MIAPTDVILGPGGFHFGQGSYSVRTLLGSCIAITLWHPRAMVGGMCHFVLPSRAQNHGHAVSNSPALPLDGRFADEAMLMFQQEIDRACSFARDYQARIFGGGNQFPGLAGTHDIDVPARNIAAAREMCRSYGLTVVSVHLGRSGSRHVALNLGNGEVRMRHSSATLESGYL